jgi:hypothetical protein
MGLIFPDEDLSQSESLQEKREAKAEQKSGYWTGAKTASGLVSVEPGIARIKSGRSDLPADSCSVSMSCSDKLLMWGQIGFQGALLDKLIGKLFFSNIVIETPGWDIEANLNTIKRGLLPHFRKEKIEPSATAIHLMPPKFPYSKHVLFKDKLSTQLN